MTKLNLLYRTIWNFTYVFCVSTYLFLNLFFPKDLKGYFGTNVIKNEKLTNSLNDKSGIGVIS